MKKDLEMYLYQLRIAADVDVIEMVCIHYFHTKSKYLYPIITFLFLFFFKDQNSNCPF